MNNAVSQNANRAVARWLLLGVAMIMVQVLLGGITRLTQSGLSITEWKPLTGALPPIGDVAWQTEFDKYKNTDQFKYVHANFTLSEFKFIFFWEWFHRLWARLLGVVFLIGFVYFFIKRYFKKEMILPFVFLFVLGGMQGAIGWIMVKSGLVPEKYFVGHVQLATHFIAALFLLIYTLWFALKLLVPQREIVINKQLKNVTILILVVLFIQLTYGAFMAGMHAGAVSPTWPTMNGEWAPHYIFNEKGIYNLTSNPFMVQFIHRGMAYLLTILIIVWYFAAKGVHTSALFNKTKWLPLILVLLQVLLGILTVINSTSANTLLWFGVAHQFVAMLLLVCITWMVYLVRKRSV